MLEFFRVKRSWDITWAHGVNNKKRLEKFIHDGSTMMIEGDIGSSNDGDIIMAHPPKKESDLTFDEWIDSIIKFHKGAKLDFKDPTVVTNVLEKLIKLGVHLPIFLNADVLKGPGGENPIFDPIEFISTCNSLYPTADYISLGWTVGYVKDGKYTTKMVKEMISLSEKSKIPITVSVLAYYLPSSWDTLKEIFEDSADTITIWGIKEIGVNDELKEWIREHMDPKRTFVDLIDKDGSPVRI